MSLSLLLRKVRLDVDSWGLGLLMVLSGCRVLYLPPYSPDLNPIEYSFSLLKGELRREGVFDLSKKDMLYLYDLACRVITPERAQGWIKHSAYSMQGLQGMYQ